MKSKVSKTFLRRLKQVHEVDIDIYDLAKMNNVEHDLLKTLQVMRNNFYTLNAANLFNYTKNKDLLILYINSINFIDKLT